MEAKIKHLAISAAVQGDTVRFYEELFGLKCIGHVVSDGYVGININGRSPGRQAGFDHFGIEVDDVERVAEYATTRYAGVELAKRPSTRPFASFSMNDPLGNIFDLTQRGLENRRDLYADNAELGERAPRHVSHIQLRTVDADRLVTFYKDVFGFEEVEPYHLSDGTVTMAISQWSINDYAGSGISRPALDHIGWEVEDIGAFDADLQKVRNQGIPVRFLGDRDEGQARLKLWQSTCRYGQRHLADPDCVLIDVAGVQGPE